MTNNTSKTFFTFLFAHLAIWTLVPTFANQNLPLDTIEALAWGNNLDWGYSKHPPLSAFFPELFFRVFGSRDWAYYFLSQLFVISSFIIVWRFSFDFFKNRIHCLISILLLEGICFYNFTSPEFNVNVCQLPFWALTVYFCWKGLKQNDITSWLFFGLFAGLGILSKYIFIYLLIALDVLLIYLIIKKEINFKCFVSLISFFGILLPHLIWLVENNYTTISYALFRSFNDPLTGLGGAIFLDYIFYPIIFLLKQIGILLPFFIMFFFIVTKYKTKINYKDKKFLFLLSITVLPIVLMLITSVVTASRIRTMGMAPFYLFIGVFFVYIFQTKIKLEKLKNFFSTFLFLFVFFPVFYLLISFSQNDERTDYPGKKISQIVQTQWKNNFSNEIEIVVGYGWIDGWYAQNLSYHLKSRPKWKNKLINYSEEKGIIRIKGINEIDDCSGILYKIEPFNDICMLGKK
jgi:hypothetical protein